MSDSQPVSVPSRGGVKSPTIQEVHPGRAPGGRGVSVPSRGKESNNLDEEAMKSRLWVSFPSPLGVKSPTIRLGYGIPELLGFPSPLGVKSPTIDRFRDKVSAYYGFRFPSPLGVKSPTIDIDTLNNKATFLSVSVPSRGKESNNSMLVLHLIINLQTLQGFRPLSG